MKLYHSTTEKAAQAIWTGGFQDGEGYYGAIGIAEKFRDVWLSDSPMDGNINVSSEALLSIQIDGRILRRYEWVEERRT